MPPPAHKPVSSWSREEIADFVIKNKYRIRAVARRKLTRTARSAVDSEDVVGSVLRRVDALAAEQKVRAETGEQLLSLAMSIAHNCSVEHSRLLQLATQYLDEDGEFSRRVIGYLGVRPGDEASTSLFAEMLAALDSSHERQFLSLRLRGSTHALIASYLEITPEAARKRWCEIKAKLVRRVDWGETDGSR